MGDRFWTDLVRIGQYRDSTIDQGFGSARARLEGGLPANWIDDFMDGMAIRRLVSSFLEPTTLSIFLALALAFGAFLAPNGGAGA